MTLSERIYKMQIEHRSKRRSADVLVIGSAALAELLREMNQITFVTYLHDKSGRRTFLGMEIGEVAYPERHLEIQEYERD